MWAYCANCDDLVRQAVYVEGEGRCCISCAEYFGTKKESDYFEESLDDVAVIEPPTYAALAEMQGRRL